VRTVHNIQADLADYVSIYWLQHKGSTRNLISLLNFLVVTAKLCIVSNVK